MTKKEAIEIIYQVVENSAVTVKDARLIIKAWEFLLSELEKQK